MLNESQCPACGFRQINPIVDLQGRPKKLVLVLGLGTEEVETIDCHVFACPKCKNVWTYKDTD